MKILFLDQFSELGGGQFCLLDLLPAVTERGWKAHLAAPGDGPLLHRAARWTEVLRLSPVRHDARFMWDTRRVTREIGLLARQMRPDLVYVNGPRLMPAVARAPVEAPVVFHAHNRLSGIALGLVQEAVERTRAIVIAASRFVWGDPRARVVYSGVAGPSGPRPERTASPAIGMIGRFSPQKGQLEFVRAAAQLPADWTFVLCGDARLGDRRYQKRVLAAAPKSVRRLGWRDDVYEVLAGLDLLVVPSAGEGGVARVILEAFSARVPVLALASGATTEVLRDGDNGFLLTSAEPQSIAARVRELMENQAALTSVAERAHHEWQEKFTVDRYRRNICDVIQAAVQPTTAVTTSGPG